MEVEYDVVQMIKQSRAVVVVWVVNIMESWKMNTTNNGGVIIRFIGSCLGLGLRLGLGNDGGYPCCAMPCRLIYCVNG